MSTYVEDVRARLPGWEVHEWRHALAILTGAFPREWAEIEGVLSAFRLAERDIAAGGGNKSAIAHSLDGALEALGWEERGFDTSIVVDGKRHESPTHKIDCFKGRIALEIEWNNKDPFYDRDLNNFRLLFDLHVVSVGVIVTRSDDLDDVFRRLGKYSSYGAATTHMGRLLPRLRGGAGGGCPIAVFGITAALVDGETTTGAATLL